MITGVVYLADRLEKPILAEGPRGRQDGACQALATATGTRLIRLQCYEGLDGSKALYEL
jgi:MoxR-like ATPase